MPGTVTPPIHRVRETCRACGSGELARFLSLGETALANAFLKDALEARGERRFPLDVHLCRRCGLVQLLDVIAPEVLFGHYLYVTGTADTMAAHNQAHAAAVVEELELGREDLVVEAASNDGSLLERYRALGVRVLGIEPARNLAARASAEGIETRAAFFSPATAREVRASHGPAKAVLANNVLAHVDEPVEFLRAARELLGGGGRVIVEVPELSELVEGLEYDTIYHEHLSYFSVTALMRVCAQAGLSIVRVDRLSVHGGSVRVWAAPQVEHAIHGPDAVELASRERATGLASLERLERFAADVARQKLELRALLEAWRAAGRAVAGYGAPAKGNTLLNSCGITTELLPYTVDKNPLKVGLLTPGQHIPVLPVEALAERRPDHVLILAWNFAEEIVRQQAAVAAHGTRFWVPLPGPRQVA